MQYKLFINNLFDLQYLINLLTNYRILHLTCVIFYKNYTEVHLKKNMTNIEQKYKYYSLVLYLTQVESCNQYLGKRLNQNEIVVLAPITDTYRHQKKI